MSFLSHPQDTMLHYSGWLCGWNCQWNSVWHHKEKLHDKTRAGLPNRSKERSASIRRSNPRGRRGRRGGNGNVQSLRVWSHMREIRESRQQIRFPLHSQFNFAELGCRSSQQVGGSILHSGMCERRNHFVLAEVEKKKQFFPYFLSLIGLNDTWQHLYFTPLVGSWTSDVSGFIFSFTLGPVG